MGTALRATGSIKPQKHLTPERCLERETECRELATDSRLTTEQRVMLLQVAQIWRQLSGETIPQLSEPTVFALRKLEIFSSTARSPGPTRWRIPPPRTLAT